MKVKELILKLQQLNQESEVILQVDSEGNSYNKLCGADENCIYFDEEVYDADWSADDACMNEEEWKEIKNRPKCVVLYP